MRERHFLNCENKNKHCFSSLLVVWKCSEIICSQNRAQNPCHSNLRLVHNGVDHNRAVNYRAHATTRPRKLRLMEGLLGYITKKYNQFIVIDESLNQFISKLGMMDISKHRRSACLVFSLVYNVLQSRGVQEEAGIFIKAILWKEKKFCFYGGTNFFLILGGMKNWGHRKNGEEMYVCREEEGGSLCTFYVKWKNFESMTKKRIRNCKLKLGLHVHVCAIPRSCSNKARFA